MDPSNRVEELEARVRALQAELAAAREAEDAPLVEQVRVRVERAMLAEGEGIEAHVGAVWLARLAMLATMTFLVLGARFTVGSDALGAWQKIGIGYVVAGAFAGYGVYRARRMRDAWAAKASGELEESTWHGGGVLADAFAKASLGCGLAATYFTTYAAFFVDETRLFHVPIVGMFAILGCLLLIGAFANAWRSQTVAGIGLFLAYYTLAVSGTIRPDLESLVYMLLACAALSVFTLVLHARHHWLALAWGPMLATHATFFYFFWAKPIYMPLEDRTYFWYSALTLTFCYLLFCIVAVVDARRNDEYRRTIAPMALLNSLFYFFGVYGGVRRFYFEDRWLFFAVFAGLMFFFAVLSETRGPRRNYLFPIFLLKGCVLLAIALRAGLPQHTFLVALAAEAMLLALVYAYTGIAVIKVIGILFAIAAFAGALVSIKMAGEVTFLGAGLQANWFNAIGVSVLLAAAAFVHERIAVAPAHFRRSYSGHWFLAESWINLHHRAAALACAAGGAILLAAFNILERGQDPALPFVLGVQACVVLGFGLLLTAPSLEAAGAMLLVAAHVCFYLFLLLPKPGFTSQEHFSAYTAALALVSFVGAHAIERYLLAVQSGEDDFDHYAVAIPPYWAATFLTTIWIAYLVDPIFVPAACAAWGLVLLLAGIGLGSAGMEASALFALGAGAVRFIQQVNDPATPLAARPDFPLFLALFVTAFAAAERFTAWAPERPHRPRRLERTLRSAFVAAGGILGAAGLYAWNKDPNVLTFYWLGHGAGAMLIGAVLREKRYRWAGLCIFLAAIGWAFTHFNALTPLYRILTFGACAGVLLIVSWLYAQSRRRASAKAEPRHG